MVDSTAVPAQRLRSADEADPLLGPRGRYVVGFDGSPASRTALVWATSRAEASGRTLVLVGVEETPDEEGATSDEGTDAQRRLLQTMEGALAASSPAVEVESRLVPGEVATALLSETEPADLLVVGSDKTGYAQGRIFGIRSLQLASATGSRVAVLPSVEMRLRDGVLVGVEDTPAVFDLVAAGAREAARLGVSLVLLHAVPPPGSPSATARGNALLGEAARVAADQSAKLRIVSRLVHRSPAEAILNSTRDKSLLLLGHSRSGGALGVGATLHGVLVNANVPVVVLP
jgi:hypothetical protein